ncbi:MAG: hypothetical protein Q9165_002036 [Trypethelium subeluteriae]
MAAPNNFQDTSYEHDPRWTKVDEYTFSHLHPASHPTNPAFTHALANSQKHHLPDISAYPNLARYVALQCRAARATAALEVGTLGGYTAIWLATLNPGVRVTSVEVNPHHAAVARENIAYAGLNGRIEVLEGSGVEVLPRLREEVEAGRRPRFGFGFVDADKENNWTYVREWVEMAEPGACVIVDNVVRRAKLVDPAKREEVAVMGARRLVEEVGKDPRLEGVVMQTVGEKNYDGFLMAVVI